MAPLFKANPVGVPGMPGESIDERILPDLVALLDRFKLRLTDGYAVSGHSDSGDHPLGLGADLVPDTARGGTWDDVDDAAKFAAEHSSTFRFVGYDGRLGTTATPNHGRGNHLHLSWNGGGTAGSTAPIKLFTGTSVKDGQLIGPDGQPVPDTPSVASKIAGSDAVTGAAKATANALLDLVTDAIGKDGGRVALSVALVLAALVLLAFGFGRMLGLGSKLRAGAGVAANLTPAGKAAGALH